MGRRGLYIYPDASRTRYSKIHTAYASQSQPFGFDRRPPNYIHEFAELIVWNYNKVKPIATIELEAITIGNSDGEFSTISYQSYRKDFGDFSQGHIIRINLKSDWQPFIIGRAEGAKISPYELESDVKPFQTWTEFGRDHVTALGHIVNWQHYEKTNHFVSQVYLEGLLHKTTEVGYLYDLSTSWQDPNELRLITDNLGLVESGYSMVEKAYQVKKNDQGDITIVWQASSDKPLIKPALVFHNWGDNLPSEIISSEAYRLGLEGGCLGGVV